MKTLPIFLAVAIVAGASSADARGCLAGAAVGGVAGHIAHHHALAGAAIGCVVGHHYATKHYREQQAQKDHDHRH